MRVFLFFFFSSFDCFAELASASHFFPAEGRIRTAVFVIDFMRMGILVGVMENSVEPFKTGGVKWTVEDVPELSISDPSF